MQLTDTYDHTALATYEKVGNGVSAVIGAGVFSVVAYSESFQVNEGITSSAMATGLAAAFTLVGIARSYAGAEDHIHAAKRFAASPLRTGAIAGVFASLASWSMINMTNDLPNTDHIRPQAIECSLADNLPPRKFTIGGCF